MTSHLQSNGTRRRHISDTSDEGSDVTVTVTATERTPLLDGSLEPLDSKQQSEVQLPIFQLWIIFLIQFCEPLTSNVIYPFVNQFVRTTGVTGGDENKTGYYAGIIESVFFWTEGLTALPWQMVSDRIGRRIPIVLAPLGLAVSTIGFGLSKNFPSLVLFRSMQGVCNGDIGVSKTVLVEIVDPSRRTQILSLMPVVYTVGILLAPFIGGVFASPETHWPHSFGRVELLREHPYLLPCLISGAVCIVTFALALVGFKESSPLIISKSTAGNGDETAEETGSTTSEDSNTSPPTIRSVLTPQVVLMLFVACIFNLVAIFYLVLQPLVWSTSIEHGGLGFDAFTIGTINSAFGFPNAAIQMLFLSKFIKKVGPRGALITSFAFCFLQIGLFPLETYFARQSGYVDWRVWSLIILQFFFSTAVFAAHTSVILFAVDATPNKASTGMVQGLTQTLGLAVRGFSPSIASSLYAFSQEKQVLGGMFVYVVLMIMSLGAIRVTFFLPKISG